MSDMAGTIASLYAAVDARDSEAIATCYHPNARFRDALFDVRGAEIVAMWRMVTDRSEDLRVVVDDIRPLGAAKALARWRAAYTFPDTRRPVVNETRSVYRFAEDGRIIEHIDAFNLREWATQALGWKGSTLARVPGGAGVLRRAAHRQLAQFMARTP